MTLTHGLVFDIRRYSIHDGPGIRTAVFFKGCALDCWWCHNPESRSPDPELIYRENLCIRCGACLAACTRGALAESGDTVTLDRDKCDLCGACVDACYADARAQVGREMTAAEVMAEVVRDAAFYEESGGGVTFTGGEPLQQHAFLGALLRASREREIHTAVDTCGFAAWDVFERIRADVDLFLYDLKLMDDARHRQYTGVPNGPILHNLQALSARGQRLAVRVPVIPGVNDDEENLRALGAFLAGLPHLDSLALLPYHQAGVDKYTRLGRPYRLPDLRPPSAERMAEIATLLDVYGLPIERS